eukprot:362716-Chlamydomonas_euryale.AAC.14
MPHPPPLRASTVTAIDCATSRCRPRLSRSGHCSTRRWPQLSSLPACDDAAAGVEHPARGGGRKACLRGRCGAAAPHPPLPVGPSGPARPCRGLACTKPWLPACPSATAPDRPPLSRSDRSPEAHPLPPGDCCNHRGTPGTALEGCRLRRARHRGGGVVLFRGRRRGSGRPPSAGPPVARSAQGAPTQQRQLRRASVHGGPAARRRRLRRRRLRCLRRDSAAPPCVSCRCEHVDVRLARGGAACARRARRGRPARAALQMARWQRRRCVVRRRSCMGVCHVASAARCAHRMRIRARLFALSPVRLSTPVSSARVCVRRRRAAPVGGACTTASPVVGRRAASAAGCAFYPPASLHGTRP